MEEDKDKEIMSETAPETPPDTPAAPVADAPADAVVEVEVEEKTEDAPAGPAPVSETEAEVEKIRAEYDAQLQKMQEKISAMEAERIALARAASIKTACEKSGYADLATVFDGVTEVDENLAKKVCKYLSDMQAKSTAEASAITPDGEATDALAEDDIPLSAMSAEQIRAQIYKKKN